MWLWNCFRLIICIANSKNKFLIFRHSPFVFLETEYLTSHQDVKDTGSELDRTATKSWIMQISIWS